jgi:hypothetical protein
VAAAAAGGDVDGPADGASGKSKIFKSVSLKSLNASSSGAEDRPVSGIGTAAVSIARSTSAD